MKNNPWVAAVLNFLIPGLGYLYLGKRMLFGGLLLTSMLISGYWLLNNPSVNQTLTTNIANVIYVIWAAAFGIDAFQEARRKNRKH